MLESLTIRNLALIESLTIQFRPGFTVLTGETGAGKSIILGALSILFGDKVDSSIIRSGESEASVTASLSVDNQPQILEFLSTRSIHLDDEPLIITRNVRLNSRGSIYVQSQPMTLSDLSFLSHSLFDIHGQSEHQSLLSNMKQRTIVDSYADNADLLSRYRKIYEKRQDLLSEIDELKRTITQAQREEDYLGFVVDELRRAELKVGEDEQLRSEIEVLSQYEMIHDNAEQLYQTLKGSQQTDGALPSVQLTRQFARKIAKIDDSFSEIASRIDSMAVELEDITYTVRDYLSGMSFSQHQLDGLQDRLAQIQRLKKKYGASIEAVLAFQNESEKKLKLSTDSSELLEDLNSRLIACERDLLESAGALSDSRKHYADILSEKISEQLKDLNMAHVRFSIDIQETDYTSQGKDSLEFMFSANLGESQRRLKEIASGGELSRVMLAIKRVLSSSDTIDTLIFDEVDTGIGGKVALAVGRQIAQIATHHQVVAITHLASIASFAQNHLVVSKYSDSSRTYSHIREVQGSERVEEIARMLSGHEQDERALEHASALLSGLETAAP